MATTFLSVVPFSWVRPLPSSDIRQRKFTYKEKLCCKPSWALLKMALHAIAKGGKLAEER
jgi:hypothetical protein